MEVLSSHKLLFRLCLLLPLRITSLLLLSSAYSPPDNYFINCGAHSNTTVDTRVFVADRGFLVGKGETVKNSNSSASSSPLYQTAKIFKHPSLYRFDINQDGTYIVRLHFFVFLSHTDLSVARFNVSVFGLSLLTNYSFRNVTISSPKIEEFLVTILKGEFKIYFMPYETSTAFVNAIEVFLGPESFIPDKALHITSQGAKRNYSGLSSNSKVLHKVHRIDVGGSTSKLDELWRNWDPDDDYLQSPESETYDQYKGGTPYYEPERINEYIAPAFVYQTARQFKDSNSNSSLPKITWSFRVNKNSNNFLRVHFSDVVSPTPNDLWFNLYINRNFSKEINPYSIAERMGAVPFYIDFVVDSDGLGFVNASISRVEDSRIHNAFLNGLEILEVVNESGFSPPEIELGKKKLSPAKIVPACSGAFFILVILVALGLKFRKPGHDKILGVPLYGGFSSDSRSTQRGRNACLAPSLNLSLRVPFSEIKRATKNFNEKLLIGEGGFGKVYKGTLNGRKVAVKRSDPRHGQGLEEFQTEITVLSHIRYRHLVSLVGYCDERREMILVYEFMEKGTLRDHLYHSDDNYERSTSVSELSWEQRLEICIAAAKGLHYLHTGPAGGIIHRDVKSTNILLDENYVAKVADFGLSKSGLPDPDNITMGVKGSFGYLDPEYLTTLQLTEKSDVYSFGVVLLEVLCARPAIIQSSQLDEVNLAEWGMLWRKRGQLEKIIDPVLVGNIKPSSLRIFGDTAEKCLKAFSIERPTMQDVLYYLSYALRLQETGMPREPFEDSTTTTITSLELQFPVVLNFPVHEDDDAPIVGDDSSDIEVSEV
ncbi:probable receptor-like protein kinase At2g23200 [Juglans microcarpa x Juglans regia]|uniref:probable receptor-like protein kinase At2g23200 n=1 Tax=Juglans microcarpa x Juglans regia TaxID=2249226 RepID=UPI001B7EF4B8|nr:probable receptor-like protein kinase At2g23200 [Juglans microcarpa x Juglans regia]